MLYRQTIFAEFRSEHLDFFQRIKDNEREPAVDKPIVREIYNKIEQLFKNSVNEKSKTSN